MMVCKGRQKKKGRFTHHVLGLGFCFWFGSLRDIKCGMSCCFVGCWRGRRVRMVCRTFWFRWCPIVTTVLIPLLIAVIIIPCTIIILFTKRKRSCRMIVVIVVVIVVVRWLFVFCTRVCHWMMIGIMIVMVIVRLFVFG